MRDRLLETSVLFELVMHTYERRSLLVISNQPFSEWENVFSTSAMTVAAVDRHLDPDQWRELPPQAISATHPPCHGRGVGGTRRRH